MKALTWKLFDHSVGSVKSSPRTENSWALKVLGIPFPVTLDLIFWHVRHVMHLLDMHSCVGIAHTGGGLGLCLHQIGAISWFSSDLTQ